MIANIFEENLHEVSQLTAIKTLQQEITYGELNQSANKVRNIISEKKVIALLFEHSVQLVISVLGVCKAGRIYIPLEPSWPDARLRYIIEDGNVDCILTSKQNVTRVQQIIRETSGSIEVIEICKERLATMPSGDETSTFVDPDRIASITYVSGFLGNPLGVIHTYRSLTYYAQMFSNILQLTKDDRITLFSPITCDNGILDLYAGLFSRATLYLYDVDNDQTNLDIKGWLEAEEITVYHSNPVVYRTLVNRLDQSEDSFAPRFIVLNGEQVTEQDVEDFKTHCPGDATMITLYGQTEALIHSFQMISKDALNNKVRLGETISETKVYIMDELRKEVGILGTGEILISSAYLSSGYWNNDEATHKRFEDITGIGRVLWTGNLGQIMVDGSIRLYGRNDSQLKRFGHRVELKEVENWIEKYGKVKDVIVLEKGEVEGYKSFWAYVIPAEGFSEEELWEYLWKFLPHYMFPAYIMSVIEFPLTSYQTIDQNALLERDKYLRVQKEYVPLVDEIEERLSRVWGRVLEIDNIGAETDFFDIGGRLFNIPSLTEAIFEEFTIEFPLNEVFVRHTIREMAEYIRTVSKFGE